VAPTKTQIQPHSPVAISGELTEQVVIDRVGDAIAEAAGEERRALLAEDARGAARRAAVEIASAALSANSAATAAHSDDVDVISEAISRRLGLSEQGVDDVIVAARLHDIGKLGVPQRIIEKPDTLDDDEWAVIRRHTIIGEQILIAVPELRGAAHLVRHSHERWDGAGYPDGLAGEEIPLGSRIVFCADAYHAIRSDRPYREGRSAAEALDEIRSCAGTQFDPQVVEALEALAGDLRKERTGNRPRPIRYRRLMALMMIVSIGACSSALARSGLMPEAKAPASSGSDSVSGDPAASGAAFQSSAPSAPGSPSAELSIGEASGSAGRTVLLTQLPAGLAVPPAALEGPSLGDPTEGSGDVLPGAPQAGSPHGVRDGGHGIGRGKGKGKGRGAVLGRGHLPKAAKPLGSSKAKAVAKGKGTADKVKGTAAKVSKKTSTTATNTTETIHAAGEKVKPKDSAAGGKVKPVKLPDPQEIVKVPKPPKPISTPDPGTGVSVPSGGGGLTGNQNAGGNGGNGNAGG
jgi:hypothetical protein